MAGHSNKHFPMGGWWWLGGLFADGCEEVGKEPELVGVSWVGWGVLGVREGGRCMGFAGVGIFGNT